MGPGGWLGRSMCDVSKFSAQLPYILFKLWFSITRCRKEAGETPDRGLPPLSLISSARGKSEECQHRHTSSAVPMGLCSGYEMTAGMFWASRTLYPAAGVRAAELRGLVGWPCHNAIQSESRHWTYLSMQLKLSRSLCCYSS